MKLRQIANDIRDRLNKLLNFLLCSNATAETGWKWTQRDYTKSLNFLLCSGAAAETSGQRNQEGLFNLKKYAAVKGRQQFQGDY